MDFLLTWGHVVLLLVAFWTVAYMTVRITTKAYFITKLEYVQRVGELVKTGVKNHGA